MFCRRLKQKDRTPTFDLPAKSGFVYRNSWDSFFRAFSGRFLSIKIKINLTLVLLPIHDVNSTYDIIAVSYGAYFQCFLQTQRLLGTQFNNFVTYWKQESGWGSTATALPWQPPYNRQQLEYSLLFFMIIAQCTWTAIISFYTLAIKATHHAPREDVLSLTLETSPILQK